MNEIQKIKNSFKIKKMCSLFIGCVSILLSLIYLDGIMTKVLAAVGLFIALVVYYSSLIRKVDRILFFEMNPQKYIEVKSVFATDSKKYDTNDFDYFVGNYAAVISAIEKAKAEYQAKGKAYLQHGKLMLLCNAYFECGNYEALEVNIEYFRNVFAKYDNPKGVYARIYKPQFEFFEAYMQGNYEECKKIENLFELHKQKIISNTAYAKLLCYYAMALEKCGENDKANEVFEEIIRFCPLLNYANIARFYLGGNGKYNQVKAGFDNDGDRHIVGEQANAGVVKKRQTSKGRMIVFFVCLAVIGILYCVNFSGKETPQQAVSFYCDGEGLNSNIEVVDEVAVDDKDNLFVLYTNDEEALCVAYLSYNRFGRYICRMVYEGVYTPDSSYFQEGYYMNAGDIDMSLLFNASVEKSDVPENAYYAKEITIGGRKVFFYISEKLDKNCVGYSTGVVGIL